MNKKFKYILVCLFFVSISIAHSNEFTMTQAKAKSMLSGMGATTDKTHFICAFPGRIKRNICSLTCIYNRRVVVEVKGLSDVYTATKNGRRILVISRADNSTAYKNNGGIADINIESDCYYEGMKITDK